MKVVVMVEVYEDVVGEVTVFAGREAANKAKSAFKAFTSVSYEDFVQAKELGTAEDLLGEYIGTKLTFTETDGVPEVTIHVQGGIEKCHPENNPENIIIHIEDDDMVNQG
ncbi:hypothetical protein JOD82_001900 [Paenibacillus sp. 1182]|uniref:hypothetical protein n=1 Tax=Paenibacillus sp. 1182 TaxID=2806565 RepID=UPI001AE45CC1|nr:hypothetical protein [Paenibacillus sp. 1182]MBP1308880.1 hypothetical protein [Paenibacillus sp. 1182]